MHNIYLPQVKICPECQKMNRKINRERPELHPVLVKSPWYHLGIDFIGPISRFDIWEQIHPYCVRLLHQVCACLCSPYKESKWGCSILEKQVCFVITPITSFKTNFLDVCSL